MVCNNLEGWGVGGRFKRKGPYVYLWLIHIVVWQKPTQHYKAIILQLKVFFFFFFNAPWGKKGRRIRSILMQNLRHLPWCCLLGCTWPSPHFGSSSSEHRHALPWLCLIWIADFLTAWVALSYAVTHGSFQKLGCDWYKMKKFYYKKVFIKGNPT